MGEFTIGRLCACMGPQGGDEFCPCRMQSEGRDGYYNCHGDKDAQKKRADDAAASFEEAMRKFAEHIAPGSES